MVLSQDVIVLQFAVRLGHLPPCNHCLNVAVRLRGGHVHVILKLAGHGGAGEEVQVGHVEEDAGNLRHTAGTHRKKKSPIREQREILEGCTGEGEAGTGKAMPRRVLHNAMSHLSMAALPIWNRVNCTLGLNTPPRTGPKKVFASAALVASNAAS